MSPQQCRAPPPGATQQLRALFIECCTGNLMAQVREIGNIFIPNDCTGSTKTDKKIQARLG